MVVNKLSMTGAQQPNMSAFTISCRKASSNWYSFPCMAGTLACLNERNVRCILMSIFSSRRRPVRTTGRTAFFGGGVACTVGGAAPVGV